jgi:hypothetical protein
LPGVLLLLSIYNRLRCRPFVHDFINIEHSVQRAVVNIAYLSREVVKIPFVHDFINIVDSSISASLNLNSAPTH